METWGSQTFPEAKFSWGQGWDSGRKAGVRRGREGQRRGGGMGVEKMEGAGKEHYNGQRERKGGGIFKTEAGMDQGIKEHRRKGKRIRRKTQEGEGPGRG